MNGTCDRCQASSRVTVATTDLSELDFCSHHFAESADALLKAGYVLVISDTRSDLLVKASSS